MTLANTIYTYQIEIKGVDATRPPDHKEDNMTLEITSAGILPIANVLQVSKRGSWVLSLLVAPHKRSQWPLPLVLLWDLYHPSMEMHAPKGTKARHSSTEESMTISLCWSAWYLLPGPNCYLCGQDWMGECEKEIYSTQKAAWLSYCHLKQKTLFGIAWMSCLQGWWNNPSVLPIG